MESTSSGFAGARHVQSYAAAGVGLAAIAVLVGWVTNQGWLKSVLPGLSDMKINTALCLALAAAVLWLRTDGGPRSARHRLGTVLAAIVVGIGAATLLQYVAEIDLGIDEVLGSDPAAAARGQMPGRMALNTAISLSLLGGGLGLLRRPSLAARVTAQYLLAAALFLPAVALLGYTYGAEEVIGLRSSTPIALHTAILLCVLSVGGLLADVSSGPMNLVARHTPGGGLIRAAIAVVVLVVPAAGWLRLQAERAGIVDLELGLATFALFNVLFVLTVAGLLAGRIDRQWIALKEADGRLLQAADERFRGVVESSVQGVLVSRDWRAIYANTEALRILGCRDLDELKEGPTLAEYVAAEYRNRVAVVRDDLVLRGSGSPSHEIRIVGRDRVERWAIMVLRRIEWMDGPATLTLLVETTERRDVEEKLRQAQKMEAVGQLTGGIAHEFNNLLAVIMGNAEDLADTLADEPEGLETLRRILRAADTGAKLTGSLLAFSRKKPLRLVALDPALVLRDVEHLARAALPETVRLTVLADDKVSQVSSDAAMLQSVVLNLVLNARDACRYGGAIRIRARNRVVEAANGGEELPPGRYVEIAVADDGEGMTEAVKARIFEPFFTTKETGKGTGLGLPMALGFVQQMGGKLDVKSKVGEGTTMTLYLPAAPTTAKTTAPVATRADTVPRRVVLVVEDNPDVLMATAAMVRKLGYTAITAIDGPTAIDVFESADGVDLLLTDVVMPNGMSGLDTARVLQRRQPWLPVVFMSGYNENVIVHHGVVDQGVNLLGKPFTRAELGTALAAALRTKPVTGRDQVSDAPIA